MSEASELLKSLSDVEYESYSAASPVNDVIEIDANGRFINIPRTEVLLGVETDKDVERKYFRCPRIVGDNIDLTKLQLRVNYQNAEQEKDAHIVQDVTVDGQYINFSWKLSNKVLAAQGTVIFTIQAVSSEQDGTLKNRWNTTLASGTVLETLIVELDYYEEEQARELLTELLQMMDNKSAESIQKIQNETNTQLGRIGTTGTQQVQAVADEGVRVLETIPADYQETYKMADEGIRAKTDAITDGVESQDTIVLTNAANDPLRGLKLYGKTKKQVTTNGYQLFDSSRIPTITGANVTVTNNGDGSFTVSGSGNSQSAYASYYEFTHKETTKLFKAGNLYLKCGIKLSPYFYIELLLNKNTVKTTNTDDGSVLIEQDFLDNPNSEIRCGFYCNPNVQIIPGTVKPMLYQDGDGTWEPFSGGQPSPNPDYPQELDSLGEWGNLFDKDRIESGTINASTGISDDPNPDYLRTSDYFNVIGGKTCTLSFKGTISTPVRLFFYTDSREFISAAESNGGSLIFPATAKYFKARWLVKDNLTDFMLNYGTTPLPWKPYTGQKEIESVIYSGNLLPLVDNVSQTVKGITITPTKDGILLNGTATEYVWTNIIPESFYLTHDTYTLQVYGHPENCQLYVYNTNDVNIGAKTSESVTKNIPAGEYSFCIEIGVGKTFNNVLIKPVLVYGETSMPYSPYQPKHSLYTPVSSGLPGIPLGQTISDKIKNSPAHMSGVYWDEEDQQYYISDTVDHESGKYIERILQQTLNGSEYDWRIQDTYFYNPTAYSAAYTALDPKFMSSVGRTSYETLDDGGYGFAFAYGWRIKFEDMNPTDNTIDELKAYLAENPITAAVIRKEPIIRDLTATEMAAYRALRTNKPTTVIFNDCKARMGVKYNVDLESRMDENAAEERHESDLAYSNSIVQNVSGEKLLIQDSSKAPLQGLKMYGKTKRFSTTGKNLLENIYRSQVVNGITVTVNDDGTITLNGTSTSETDIAIRTHAARQLLKAGTYMLSGVSEELKSKCYLFGSAYSLSYTFTTLTDDRRYFTLETDDEMYLTLRIYNGATFLNDTIYPMIRLASITDGTYEPYTGGIPSPNPAYPQELNSLGKANGQIESGVTGKNLFDKTTAILNERVSSKDGTIATGFSQIAMSDYINVSGISSFYISGDVSQSQTDHALAFYDKNKLFISGILNGVTSGIITNKSYDVPNNAHYVRFNFALSAIDNIQLEIGTEATAYEPYCGQSLLTKLPNGLPGIEVTDPSLATYTDEDGIMWCADEVDYENGKYVQRVGETIFNGTESYIACSIAGQTVNRFAIEFRKVLPASPILCNCLKQITYATDSIGVYRGGQNGTDHSLYIKTTHSTVDELKAWLAEQYTKGTPVTVQGILATPIIHDLTPEQMKAYKALRTNHPTTIITNDCDAYMDVKYNVDLEIKMEDDAAEERYESDLKYGGAIVQTIQGEALVATDSAKAPFLGMKLFGKTEQVTTTGKNLLNNAHKELLDNNIQYNLPNSKPPIKLQGGTTYTLTCFATVKPTCLYLINYDTNIRIQLSYTYSITYTPENDINVYIDAYWHDDIGGVPSYAELMLEVGSESTDFEQYTGGQPSPSPDYPQELKIAGQASGQIESEVYGKNWLKSNLTTSKTLYGITITPNSDGSFSASGTATATAVFENIGSAEVKKDNTYFLSGTPTGKGGNTYQLYLTGAPNPTIYEAVKKAITVVKDGIMTLSFIVYSGQTINFTVYPQLELGSTATDYEPYTEQSLITKTPNGLPGIPLGATIPDAIQNSPIHMSGVWWDSDEEQYYISDTVDRESGMYMQRIWIQIFDGIQGYIDSFTSLTNHTRLLGYIKDTSKRAITHSCLCNRLKKYSSYDGDFEHLYVDNYAIWLFLPNDKLSQYADVSEYLKDYPLIVQYILAEPIVRDLTSEELKAFKALRSNYPTTTIMNDANAHMEASYVVDTKTYIDKKFAELAARLSQ